MTTFVEFGIWILLFDEGGSPRSSSSSGPQEKELPYHYTATTTTTYRLASSASITTVNVPSIGGVVRINFKGWLPPSLAVHTGLAG